MDSDSSLRTLATVHYYLREGFYGTALSFCDGRGGQEEAEQQLAVLKGVALVKLGKSAEALRALEPQRSGQCELGALYCLKEAHALAANPDKQSLAEIETAIATATKEAPEVGFVSAAEVLFFLGHVAKAKGVLERLVKAQQNYDASRKNVKMHCLLGWIEISMGKDQRTTKDMFDLAANQGYPDGFVGMSRLYEAHHSAGEMKAVTKELITNFVSFLPGHIERSRAALVARDWDGVLQALQNSSLAAESNNAIVAYLLTIHAICAAGNNVDAALTELKSALDSAERDNHFILYRVASLLIRCAARNKAVLLFARNLLVRALQLSRRDEYQVEELRLAMAMEDAKETTNIAKELIQAGCQQPFAVLGMAMGYLMSGRVKEAAEQYEFVNSTHPTITSVAVYHFVGGLIALHKDKSFDVFLTKVHDAMAVHRAIVQNKPFGLDYLEALDVDLLFSMAMQVFDYAPLMPVKSPNETLKTTESILQLIVDACPGLSVATFSLAKVHYLKSESELADQMIDLCLRKNETVADAYLLRAQIRVDKGQVQEADTCLNTGLNFNFAVRDSPLFHLIKSKVFKRREEYEKAADLLRSGLKDQVTEAGKDSANVLARRETGSTHRIALQIELIDCLQTMRRTHEAESVMSSALAEWRGKSEEQQLLLLNADLLVSKGDPDSALALLSKVQASQSTYQSARIKMAEIYLEEKKDKRMFTVCYKELMSTSQTPSTLTLLGDAYMSIQEPEKAIEVYEKALKLSTTRDIALTEKIGEAYVMCHLFTKAVNFYESAMNANKDPRMRLKLAELLLKLGNTEKCERILKQPLSDDPNPIDASTISSQVKFLQLLSRLHSEGQKWNEAYEDLNLAKQLQMKLVQRNDSPTNILAKKEVARIDCLMGDMRQNRREMKDALDLFNDALSFDPANVKILVQIAGVYLATNRPQKCSDYCKQVLNIDKNNDEATLMMADLLYMQNDSDQALVHFANHLEKYPNQYHALARFIELSWRRGNVEQAEKQLRRAVEHNPRATVDSGYNYCKGLHEWYSGEPNAALHVFNRARKDPEWGDRSLCNIIEIILNPENEVVGGEVLDHSDNSDTADLAVGTKNAERFLNELRMKGHGSDNRYSLMENFIMLAGGERNKVQQAMQNMLLMVGAEGQPVESVGAVLGVARAYMSQKQTPKAKAILKRVIGHPWTLEDADYLEKCWLLLADLYINQNKQEQAYGVLRTIISKNQSCIRAFEFCGHLKEKEAKFGEAASYYDEAWRFSQYKNCVLGYKLAYNYLKCKRLFDCLDVCHRVLAQEPTYPRIRKEIMEKARMLIRS